MAVGIGATVCVGTAVGLMAAGADTTVGAGPVTTIVTVGIGSIVGVGTAVGLAGTEAASTGAAGSSVDVA